MKYILDLHTHTIASGHAYTTLLENAKYASEIGLKILGTTEHGPKMPHAPHIWYFYNYKVLPRKIYGVTMLHGCEVKDRKSTRLNSSHANISYAVFCLKKKKMQLLPANH